MKNQKNMKELKAQKHKFLRLFFYKDGDFLECSQRIY